MTFDSLNFKLVVIEELLLLGYFNEEINDLIEKHWDDSDYSYEPIPEILNFCKNLIITQDKLDQITSLTFDGGNEIYHHIVPNWDGEDSLFDVDSIVDVEKLPNLEKFCAISMITTEDYTPLLKLENLNKVLFPNKINDKNLLEKLSAKGVTIK